MGPWGTSRGHRRMEGRGLGGRWGLLGECTGMKWDVGDMEGMEGTGMGGTLRTRGDSGLSWRGWARMRWDPGGHGGDPGVTF